METAGSVITDALREIGAQAAEISVSQKNAQNGLLYLNLMMSSFSAQGIDIGFSNVSSFSDAITVPDGAIEPIVKNLALELSPLSRGGLTNKGLFDDAQLGFDTLLQISMERPGPQAYSDSTPVGSGNQHTRYEVFYRAIRDPIYNELGGNIGLEDIP